MRKLVLCAALAALPAAALAVEVGDGKLSVNGSASWGYYRTSENTYFGDEDGDYDTAMFALLLTARPEENLVLTAQAGFDQDEVSLEWAFAEYRFTDWLRLRAGKVKHPFGNYGELQFVGTTRPFFTLATSVYGPANMASDSYWGVGLTGEVLAESGFGVGYDLYGGALDIPSVEPYDFLTGEVDRTAAPDAGVQNVEDIVGGRVSLVTPWDLTLRLSGYGGNVSKDEEEKLLFLVYGASVFYRGEILWVSAEAFRSVEYDYEDETSAYVEAAAFVLPKLQVAARYEVSRTNLVGFGSDSDYLRHDEAAIGLSYWVTPQFVARASYHNVQGKRFTLGEVNELGYHQPINRTNQFIGGVQYAF